MNIKTYYCKKDTIEFPKCFEGKYYKGILDNDGDLWLFDEWWLSDDCDAKESEFDLEIHGSFVERCNRKCFEVVE